MISKIINKEILIYIIMGLLVIGVLIPSALNREIPTRDSGVFLYTGWQILNGKIPYVDVWDHKPPFIYYINSFGLFIGNGSAWGVLFLEFLALYFALILGFVLLRQAFGLVPAFFSSISWLFSTVLLIGSGNFIEEFALPFQFAALYLFISSEKHKNYSWRRFLLGILFALTFLLRPNSIGIVLSILILLLLTGISSNRGNLLKDFSPIFLGIISIFIITFIFLTWHNALASFFDQVFYYNFVYSNTYLENRLGAIIDGFRIMSISGIFFIALISLLAIIFYLWFGKNQIENRCRPLMYLSIIGVPMEFFLISVTGRSYEHYYITWLPLFSILISFFAYVIIIKAHNFEVSIGSVKFNLTTICLFALLLSLIFIPVNSIFHPSIIGLPFKVFLVSASGSSYITWLPLFVILISFFVYTLITITYHFEVSVGPIRLNSSLIWLFALLISIIFIFVYSIPYLSIIRIPVEFFLNSGSGRSYVIWLPLFVILIGFFAYSLIANAYFELSVGSMKINLTRIWLFVLLISIIFIPVYSIFNAFIRPPDLDQNVGYDTIKYIRNSTNASDYVLIWGAETSINFVTKRQSPVRFVYQYPLYTQNYQNDELVKEFLNDIKFNKPVLIIDTSPSNPTIPPINRTSRAKWEPKGEFGQPWGLLDEMEEVFGYIDHNYEITGTIGKEQWQVYKYVKDKKT